MKDFERVRGTLFGVAVGDALGAPVEFMSAADIRRRFGTIDRMVGYCPGTTTDDTAMTICVAEGILDNPEAPIPEIGKHFIRWYKTNPVGIGRTCSNSIARAIRSSSNKAYPDALDWLAAAKMAGSARRGQSVGLGNGSLMRTAYVGLYYDDEREIRDKADLISRMTHSELKTSAACVAYSTMIARLVKADTPDINIVKTVADAFLWHDENYNYDTLTSSGYVPRPTGYVVDTFATALHCLYTTDSFKDALIKAVNLGGDTDTIAAVTGGLAGAIYGDLDIPDDWRSWLSPQIARKLRELSTMALRKLPVDNSPKGGV